MSLLLGKALKAAGESEEALVYLEEAQKEFSAAGASDRVQQALDAVLGDQAGPAARGNPKARPRPRSRPRSRTGSGTPARRRSGR